uniref:Zinc finger and SCAN domain-containing protein 10 n=1 Tax=Cacopsylla melanoneura TaxID=428564 RepID=A0A8D8U5K9_9HEMI
MDSHTPCDVHQEMITVKEEIGTDEEYDGEANMIVVEEINMSGDTEERNETEEEEGRNEIEEDEEGRHEIEEEERHETEEEEEGRNGIEEEGRNETEDEENTIVEDEERNETEERQEEEEHYMDPKVNVDINAESGQERVDLFQQPFVMDYLHKYINTKDTEVNNESLQIENEYETFVNSRCVCRLCTKSDQKIFMRLFFNDQRMTPIANKIAYLMGTDKVELDLLPQQICLGCSELVDSSYSALMRFTESYEILSDIVAEFKEKTHVFYKKKDKKIGICLNVSDKGYQFSPKIQSVSNTPESNTRVTRQTIASPSRVKCYLCMKSFASGDLQSHVTEAHGCKIEYKCVKCSIAFPTFADLTNHMNKSDTCGSKENEEPSNIKLEYESENENDNEEEIAHYEVNIVKQLLAEDDSLLAGNRKKKIVSDQYQEMLKEGKVECRSCNYCKRLFKSTASEELIKSHILVHLFSSAGENGEAKDIIDINTLDLTEHIGSTCCYVCTFCKMPKLSPEALREHLSQFCSTFANMYSLKIRDRRRHGKTRGKPHHCKICADAKPYKNKEYKAHMLENHPELIMQCMHCPSFFFERSVIQFHIMTKHVQQTDTRDEAKKPKKRKKGSILCEFCSRECQSKVGYRLHVLKTHLNGNKGNNKTLRERRDMSEYAVMHCHICDKIFRFKEGKPALEFHIKRHDYPNNKIQCCNREYINYAKYRKHIASHSKTWPCKVCSMKCESMVLLQDHVTECHTQCKECGYVAKNYQDHTKHTQQAHGQDVVCVVCNLMFNTRKELMIHKRQFHWEEVAGENGKQDLPEPVLCCGRTFIKKENLKRHTAKHQDTICKTCGDMLKSKLALLSHNATHHRQGVECGFCHKTFTNADSLKYHMLRHTQGRQFNCACGLSFYTEADMHKHQRTRKTPCLGKLVEDQTVDTVIVNPDEVMMDWEVEESELN